MPTVAPNTKIVLKTPCQILCCILRECTGGLREATNQMQMQTPRDTLGVAWKLSAVRFRAPPLYSMPRTLYVRGK